MAKERPFLASLNGGEVSPLSLARIDLARMRLTAEVMLNVIPSVIGKMQFRPGLGFGASTANDNYARNIPFVFAADDTALVEVSDLAMRFIVDNAAISRVAVSTVVTNGDFSSATGWTTTTTVNGVASISGGVLTMRTPTRGGTTLCKRSVTVGAGDLNKEHGLRIVVTQGPVTFRCGSTDGGDEYIRETELNTGTYSLTLTPTGDFFVQFSCKSQANRIVDSITVEAAGVVTLTAPWAAADLSKLRWKQSGDVIFVANTTRTYKVMKIERRSTRAWGLTVYEFKDGPFRGKTANVVLDPSERNGNITITSDLPFFRSTHVGALLELTHSNTVVQNSLGGDDEYTDTYLVTGVDADGEREVAIGTTGTWAGTLTLQASYDDGLTWTKRQSWTTNTTVSVKISGDNIPVLVRLGFVGSDHTSGSVTAAISGSGGTGGGGSGVVRITAVASSTSASAEVVKRLHHFDATKDWQAGRFSDVWGWPSALEFFDGRLWFCDNDKLFGSVSDDFTSFDLDEDGDSGPIIRSIATGPVNRGLWMLGLARLVIGTVGAEAVGRSSSFDEPITPTNFSIKDASTQGSADIASVKVDKAGLFIQRNGQRAYLIRFDVDAQDYASVDISRYNPTILGRGNVHVVGCTVQRQPDTRFWFWLSDGTAAMLVYEPSEDVIAWDRFETDGSIEDIAVLPNDEADDVYMIVNRTIGGVTKRYREKMAYDHQAEGGSDNFIADSYVVATIAGANLTGLSHLNGKQVVAWVNGSPVLDADGAPALFTVAGGLITPGVPLSGVCVVGLPYEGFWKSTKLAYGAQMGTAVSQPKIIKDFAPILYKTHIRGLRYGRDFDEDNLSDLPLNIAGEGVPFDTFLDDYDASSLAFEGEWNTDSRICLHMRAPLPCTVLGLSGAVLTHEMG